jgi:hypothetical protein
VASLLSSATITRTRADASLACASDDFVPGFMSLLFNVNVGGSALFTAAGHGSAWRPGIWKLLLGLMICNEHGEAVSLPHAMCAGAVRACTI